MKSFKIKCKLQLDQLPTFGHDEIPQIEEKYTVIGIKEISIKGTDKKSILFKFKEFDNNSYIHWFSEKVFEYKEKDIENRVDDWVREDV